MDSETANPLAAHLLTMVANRQQGEGTKLALLSDINDKLGRLLEELAELRKDLEREREERRSG